jgi:iron(III) transport system substrate-binding protein
MIERADSAVTRRRFLTTGALATAAVPFLTRVPRANAATKVLDFSTNADVAKAEAEGEVVYYGHDSEPGIATLLDAFKKDFPKIKTSYVRLQTGALYAKVTAERSAGRFGLDVLQLSDISPAIDFQKKGGWEQYMSPEYAAYKPEYHSTPPGYYGVPGVGFAGIAYNKSKLKAEQAPKTWKDINNPAYKDGVSEARDLGHAALAVVHPAQDVRQRLLAGVRQAATEGLRRPGPALRPAGQGR